MDIAIVFAPKFSELANHFSAVEQQHDLYDTVLQNQAVSVSHGEWTFVCMPVDHCFEANFARTLKKLSTGHNLYFFAVNDDAEGLWFEHYDNGELTRQWIEAEQQVAGNMGDYLPEEQHLGFPFVDESYEDVGEEMLYELIYEITDFDITETF